MGPVHTQCPQCGEGAANFDNCEVCGIDTALYKKACDMSKIYYNKGLRLANADNLTAAIDCLTSSLQINKKNIEARNLLGLCYHAMGRVGEALREWVISVNYSGKDNAAQEYLDSFNHMPQLERYSEGLRNYNEALRYLVQHSDDLATIRLKRAVELIPNFVDAINLLALVHIKDGDKMRAGGLIERTLDIDVANPAARRYYREVFRKRAPGVRRPAGEPETAGPNRATGRPAAKQPAERDRPQQSPFGVQNQRVFNKRSPIPGIISFAVGLGAMFLFMYILVMPSFLEDALRENETLTAELSNRQAAHSSQIAYLEEQNEQLTGELAQANAQIRTQQNYVLDAQNENRVNTGHAYLTQNMHAQALSAIEGVETHRLSPESLEIYNLVRRTSMPVMEQHYFSLGQGLFNGNNYPDARFNLERAAAHIDEGSNLADQIFYLLGRIAETDGNFELARQYYETIINEHPGSNRVNAANLRLNMIPD